MKPGLSQSPGSGRSFCFRGPVSRSSSSLAHDELFQFVSTTALPARNGSGGPLGLGQTGLWDLVFLAESEEQMIGELHDSFLPVGERRDAYAQKIEPMKEIFPESSFTDHGPKILVGGGDDPYFHPDFFRPPDSPYDSVFDGEEDLGLGGKGQAGDLVEKEGSLVGGLEKSDPRVLGIGESPFFMAEQFGLDQVFGNGRAIELNERKFRAGAILMHPTGVSGFARTGWPVNQKGRKVDRETPVYLENLFQLAQILCKEL